MLNFHRVNVNAIVMCMNESNHDKTLVLHKIFHFYEYTYLGLNYTKFKIYQKYIIKKTQSS